jgi:uncharacterized membrane protein YgdD (TMEM256/DUF423 family)
MRVWTLRLWTSLLTIAAGLFGAAGIGAAAYAAHGRGGPDLAIASQFLLIHATAVCAIAVSSVRDDPPFQIAATTLAAGTALFCGDLACRGLLGVKLFGGAAPMGGLLMLAGWLGISLAAALTLRRRPAPARDAAQHALDNSAS